MATDDVENSIRRNITWAKLSDEIRTVLGGSQREYDKRILDYSIKNQLRYKDNIVRFVKKNQEEYYESLLSYSKSKMMLYPYHLSNILVRELRVTPFTYYTDMMIDIMQSEKSYDSIPNFTAVDTMRLLGVGRNQYIDLMNQNRANRRLFRRSKSVREILPQKPANIAPIEPWFLLCYGCILENDIRMLTSVEKELIDKLMDEGPILCGLLDIEIVQRLLSRGLVYLDVPANSADFVFVPTLDGFVMNRVQGDYFETLLYKIFVSIDGQNSVQELSDTIGIDIDLVKNAISVFCRLGFVKKRVTGIEGIILHTSWNDYSNGSNINSPTTGHSPEPSVTNNVELTDLSFSLMSVNASTDFDEEDIVAAVENVLKVGTDEAISPSITSQQFATSRSSTVGEYSLNPPNRRIAFIFDSTLTAFLMMGNLSASLKNHAVTLFEVGKLSDDSLDNFIDELQNINFFAEGEAQRYSEHAKTLLYTIQCIRSSSEIDLIRGESLLNLETAARLRVIEKSYKQLISMAPIGPEACSIQHSSLPYLGTASIELTSPWFRLFLYELAGSGPSSLFIPMGTHLTRLPKLFWHCQRLMLTQGNHEPIILPIENALIPIEEALLSAPIFLQAYSDLVSDAEIVNIPFPFDDDQKAKMENDEMTLEITDTETTVYDDAESENIPLNETASTVIYKSKPFSEHPVVKKLHSLFKLNQLCGYLVLLKLHNTHQQEDMLPMVDDSSNSLEKTNDDVMNTASLLDAPSPSGRMFSSPSSAYSLNTFQLSSTVTKDPRKISTNRVYLRNGESFDDYVLLDCVFGIPLFDDCLNKTICQRLLQNQLLSMESFNGSYNAMENIITSTKQFMGRFLHSITPLTKTSSAAAICFNPNTFNIPHNPTTAVLFNPNSEQGQCQSLLTIQ